MLTSPLDSPCLEERSVTQPYPPGTGPLPGLHEVAAAVKTLQSGLGAFVQLRGRGDQNGAQQAAARTVGAYRKLLATYEVLPDEERRDIYGSMMALHETLTALEVPVGRFRASEPPPELAPAEAPPEA